MGWDINFDLEKFVGLIGTQFHISGLWRAGQSLSSATIGNDFVVSSIYGSEQFRFYNLYLEQSLCDDRVNLRIGRLGAGDDFATSEIYWNFVTNAIDGNPISIPKNVFFPCYPAAVWGARMRCDITDNIYTTTGIYNGDPGVPRMSMYGLDFSLRLKRGIIFAQEVAYTPNVYRGCPTGKGLPGHYKVGAFYHGGTFRDYSTDVNGTSTSISGLPAKKIIGNYGIYFHADQMIYKKKGTDCDEGLTPFVVVTLAPDNINEFPFFIDGGFIFKGLVPTRNHDITSVGFAYGKYSDSLRANERDNAEYNGSTFPIQSYELIFDFSYKLEITAWMFLQPDIQYIVNPAGGHDIDNALVVGSRFDLTF
jgi:porin